MSDIDRQMTGNGLTGDQTPIGLFTAYEDVDKSKYELIHPDLAMVHFKMTPRTAYRHMDSGKLPYTIDKEGKKILRERSLTLSDPLLPNLGKVSVTSLDRSENVTDISIMHATIERLMDNIADSQQSFLEKEDEIKQLRDELGKLNSKHSREIQDVRQDCQTTIDVLRLEKDTKIDQLQNEIDNLKTQHYDELQTIRENSQSEIDQLRKQLESERIEKARMEGDVKRIESIEQTIDAQIETISSQKSTIVALNNERIVITQQLQKYRGQESYTDVAKPPGWMFWKR
jgi:chromosome segregation ATPase